MHQMKFIGQIFHSKMFQYVYYIVCCEDVDNIISMNNCYFNTNCILLILVFKLYLIFIPFNVIAIWENVILQNIF